MATLALIAGCIGRGGFDRVRTNDDCSGFVGGTHDGTRVVDGRLELTGTRGAYTSTPCATANGTTLEVEPLAPYLKPLSNQPDLGYTEGAASGLGLVGLWHLDGTGPIADEAQLGDSSGRVNAGAAHNGGSGMAYAPGRFREGVSFDGIDDFIEVPYDPSLAPARVTIAAWFLARDLSHECRIASKAESGGWELNFGEPGFCESGFCLLVHVGGDYLVAGIDVDRVVVGRWHHVVGTYDGLTATLFLDGVPAASATGPGGDIHYANDNSMCIGAEPATGTGCPEGLRFDGIIDEVVIWERALSNTEVLGLYERGALRFQLQAAACSEPACAGATFVGPDGTAGSTYSELMNDTPSPPTFLLTGLPQTSLFQWRAMLETDASDASPVLLDVRLLSE